MYKLKHSQWKTDWVEHAYNETVQVKGGVAFCESPITRDFLCNLGFNDITGGNLKQVDDMICPHCGFHAASDFGLRAHIRMKHKDA